MSSRHTDVIEVTRCTITIVTEEGAAGAPWAEIVAHTQLLSSLDFDTKCRNKIAALSPSSPETIFNSISRTMIDSDKKTGRKKINKNMLSIGLGQYHVD